MWRQTQTREEENRTFREKVHLLNLLKRKIQRPLMKQLKKRLLAWGIRDIHLQPISGMVPPQS